jgi:hypothetical protein
MKEITSYFLEKKYVHLKDVADKVYCKQLSDCLIVLANSEFGEVDEQCPKSKSIYGVQPFEFLLNQLTPLFSQVTGKNLLPTYSYARLYKPGEELKNHTDRASCEITATITLGFDGNVWPIYVGDSIDKRNPIGINMEVGDAVLYFGTEKHHWREIYTEGKWQTQVFLHYVDADGKHKDWEYDKRCGLNLC